MGKFYQYDTRGASPASQLINAERMIEERDTKIEQLTAAIKEYAEAYAAVITFTHAYLDNNGDTSRPPEEWAKLDDARGEKFVAMLKLAGVVQ